MTLALLLILFVAVFRRVQFTLPIPMHPSTIFHITCTYHSDKWGGLGLKIPEKLCHCFTKYTKPWTYEPPPPPPPLMSQLFYFKQFFSVFLQQTRKCVLYFVSIALVTWLFALNFLYNFGETPVLFIWNNYTSQIFGCVIRIVRTIMSNSFEISNYVRVSFIADKIITIILSSYFLKFSDCFSDAGY